jgi:hypothetical protein
MGNGRGRPETRIFRFERKIMIDDGSAINVSHVYEAGSEACRNYSRLTLQTRTLSQQVLVAGTIGLAAAIASKEASDRPWIIFGSGVVLILFSVSLGFVDWHYQSAFTAIRNSLARIEHQQEFDGPWTAHLSARTEFKDHVASYMPFLLLFTMGCGAMGLGLGLGLSKWGKWWGIQVPIILLAGAWTWFWKACSNAKERDLKFKFDLQRVRTAPTNREAL